jgi:transposase
MARPKVYPDELRERAVRLVREWREARGVTDGGFTAVCTQLGLHRETLRRWVIEAEVEGGSRPGVPRAERDRMAEWERENRELRRANNSQICLDSGRFGSSSAPHGDRRGKRGGSHHVSTESALQSPPSLTRTI